MLGVGKKVISQGIEETKRRISRSKEKSTVSNNVEKTVHWVK